MSVGAVASLWCAAVLTASADVDMQVAFDNGAAFERLSGIHGVDDLLLAYFITQTVAGRTGHTGDRQTEVVNVQRVASVTHMI